MPHRRGKVPALLGMAFLLAFIIIMIYTSRGNDAFRVEVCATWEGKTICRNGASATREDAERVALDGACTDLSHGMTNYMQCRSNAERTVRWRKDNR
jgi:hypothetical protein